MLLRKKDLLAKKIMDLERGKHRMELKIEKMDFQVRDVQSLARNRKNLPTIFFVTPTGPRLEQKADLIRLAQTLSHIPNLYWIVVEDADEPSTWIKGILERSKLSYIHLAILTPLKMKLKDTDPNWKLPRGVVQRNTALRWIRTNFGSLKKGVIYFGDDDNTYDWRLFEEIRNINKAGVWPVGLKMGERKGQNFYYPPDFNYKVHGNLNRYHGTHALRERAAKIGQGILIIRFEMPFNVWCLGCNNHVGMGVRYNAEKKKIGMYYTTPLYEFRMKCHLCDNYFVIRTDPKNFDYELVEGLRRQEKRFDSGELDNVAPVDRTFNQKLASDAMFKAEHEKKDKEKSDEAEGQVNKLEMIQSRMYDDYGVNSFLRNRFRAEKKFIGDQRLADEGLKKRLSLDIPLQPETNEDRIMATRMLKYKDLKSHEDRQKEAREEIVNRPLFESLGPSTSTPQDPIRNQLKNKIQQKRGFAAEDKIQPVKKALRSSLGIVVNSKLSNNHRKNISKSEIIGQKPLTKNSIALVDYESDSSDSNECIVLN
uniref:Galactosylgalactosylxylosylprotein 3-beta-glucuronosyltransferase n=1 Tax=Acrobeloides nanus TaxID=290746 RepID=A0A914DSJ0_9BILA